MKKIFVFFAMALIIASFVTATECGTAPTEDCDFSTSTTTNAATRQLNDTAGDGAIRVNSSNVIVNFNNSYLYGNSTPGSIGILIGEGLTNVTIRDMRNVSGYTYPIRIDSTTQPNFASMSYTMDNVTYSYSSTTEVLTISCEGTGTIGLSQLDNIDSGISTYYDVYHAGTYVETVNTDTYTLSSCSTWTFSPTSINRRTYSTAESSLFFIMIFLIVFGGIYLLMTGDLRALIPIVLGATVAVHMLSSML